MIFLFVELILEVWEKSDGEFDNGQGELADAAAALIGWKEKILIILNVGYLGFLLDL